MELPDSMEIRRNRPGIPSGGDPGVGGAPLGELLAADGQSKTNTDYTD